MKSAHAVIGGNWGDEGKGLAVDALAAELGQDGGQVCVIRSNGGAQAGHGVERPGGGRHVFHHIGAGSFTGAATHLSQFFVAHPMLLEQEARDLEALGCADLKITIDPRAPVTTPWDMAINQALEIARAGGRHGSTGLGFGETIERQEKGPGLVAGDLWGRGLLEKLEAIREIWLPARLEALGIDAQASALRGVFDGTLPILERFAEDCARFRARVGLLGDVDLGAQGQLLFEGAQGLQLDMDFGVFPHVTRSHTGLRNMLTIGREAGIELIRPLYMSRAYATRHGAGPLPHETCGTIDWAEIVDLTNAANPWQGIIRQAPLDADLLAKTIDRDLALASGTGIEIDPGLGVTCLDQIRGMAQLSVAGGLAPLAAQDLPGGLAERVGLPVRLISHGPTRATAKIKDHDVALAA